MITVLVFNTDAQKNCYTLITFKFQFPLFLQKLITFLENFFQLNIHLS